MELLSPLRKVATMAGIVLLAVLIVAGIAVALGFGVDTREPGKYWYPGRH